MRISPQTSDINSVDAGESLSCKCVALLEFTQLNSWELMRTHEIIGLVESELHVALTF